MLLFAMGTGVAFARSVAITGCTSRSFFEGLYPQEGRGVLLLFAEKREGYNKIFSPIFIVTTVSIAN